MVGNIAKFMEVIQIKFIKKATHLSGFFIIIRRIAC